MSYSHFSPSVSFKLQNKTNIETADFPMLNPEQDLDVLYDITLSTGDVAQIIKLKHSNIHAAMDIQDTYKNNPKYQGKYFLIDRSVEDYGKIIDKGALLGLSLNHRVLAIAGIAPAYDLEDLGRNQTMINDDNIHLLELHQVFKSILGHASLTGYGINLKEIFYAPRICIGATLPGRPLLMLSTNNTDVKKFYGEEKNWIAGKAITTPEAELSDSKLTEDERYLVPYSIMLKNALNMVEKDSPDIYAVFEKDILTALELNQATMGLSGENKSANDNQLTAEPGLNPV